MVTVQMRTYISSKTPQFGGSEDASEPPKWSVVDEVQQALKFFNKALADKSLKLAVRIWALVLEPLQLAGAHDAAKGIVEAIASKPGTAVQRGKRALQALGKCVCGFFIIFATMNTALALR